MKIVERVVLWVGAIAGIAVATFVALELYAAHLQSVGINPFN